MSGSNDGLRLVTFAECRDDSDRCETIGERPLGAIEESVGKPIAFKTLKPMSKWIECIQMSVFRRALQLQSTDRMMEAPKVGRYELKVPTSRFS